MTHPRTRHNPVRRWLVCALVVAVVVWFGSLLAIPAGATGHVTMGSGLASGHVFAGEIPYGGLTLGIAGGEAKASYFEDSARASAYTFDPKVLGLINALRMCDSEFPFEFPPPTTADTNRTGGKAESHETRRQKDDSTSFGTETASATPGSRGSGTSTLSGMSLPGIVTVTGGVAQANVSATSAGSRSAVSTVELGSISLLGGLVKMGGLRWTLSHRVDGADSRTSKKTRDGRFTLGSASVAGVPFPTDSEAQFATFVAAMNTATRAFGLQLRLPELREAPGGYTLTPMTIAIGGKTSFGPALNELLAGANGLSLLNVFNLTQGTVFDSKNCDQLLGAMKAVPQANYFWNLFGALTPIVISAIGAAFNGGAEINLSFGGVTTAIDDTYYPVPEYPTDPLPPAPEPRTPDVAASGELEAPPIAEAPQVAPQALPVTTDPVALVRAVCRSASEQGRTSCWDGAAKLAGWLSLAVVLGLLAADEGWRRKRHWHTIKKEIT